MMTDKTKTPQKIFLQEEYGRQEYGIEQDDNIRGMVRYFRCDEDYNKIKGVLAIALMDYLDNNKPEGKMCLSNGECKNIDDAFDNGDWDKIYAYIKKKLEKRGEEQKYTPKHKVGDTIYYNSFGELKSMIVAYVTTDSTDNPMYEDENGNAVFEKDLVEQKLVEDERIKESLLKYLHTLPNHYSHSGVCAPEWITWVEKQVDKDKLIKELGEYKVKYTQEVLEKHINSMENKDDERLRKTTISFLKDFTDKGYENAVECIDWLEKQGNKPQSKTYTFEGKSVLEAINEEKVDNANKVVVESKFKVGDWVMLDRPVLITKVEDMPYNTHQYWTSDGTWFGDGTKAKLWNIEDAKDGDVLAFDNDTIVIFKDLYNATTFHSYCYIEDGVFDIGEDDMPDWWEGEGFKPATKEQRDILFTKIKEAGYEWDVNNLKLLKKQ